MTDKSKDNMIDILLRENERLNAIIDETIDCIKWYYDLSTKCNVQFCDIKDKLLEILEETIKSENVENYENVIIRDNKEIGINNYGLDYLISLEQKIDRAIEYIKEELIPYGDDWCWDDFSIKDYVLELLEILGDKENEQK